MATFLSLPAEIRNMIYDYLLVRENPIDPIHHRPRKFAVNGNILFTNKTIHLESSFMLYARNCFELYQNDDQGEATADFLNVIGDNAAKIQSIYTDFFGLAIDDELYGQKDIDGYFGIVDYVECRCSESKPLETIRRRCTSLKIMISDSSILDALRWVLNTLEDIDPECQDHVLSKIEYSLRQIPSLQEIVLYDGYSIREQGPGRLEFILEVIGWKIKLPPVGMTS